MSQPSSVIENSITGQVGPGETRVQSVGGSSDLPGVRVRQTSGAFLTVHPNGTWVYEAPAAAVQLKPGERAYDGFQCEFETCGVTRCETFEITMEHGGRLSAAAADESRQHRDAEELRSAPARIFVWASDTEESRIDLKRVADYDSPSVPAVLILESPSIGEASVCEDSGDVIFRGSGTSGQTEVRCLTENRHGSATFVVIHVTVSGE